MPSSTKTKGKEKSGSQKKEGGYIRWFDDLDAGDVAIVGGKNASLGEMIGALKDEGVRVPDGFATTAEAYRLFLKGNGIEDKIREELEALHDGKKLQEVGKAIRRLFQKSEFPEEIAGEIRKAYTELSGRYDQQETDIAARSSATAEDLPEASFAGQQETFLNVSGEDDVLEACKKCYASLYTDRAIAYREEHGFEHLKVALSVAVQKMVRSDRACSGVMFTLDTESGFRDVVVIDGAWGLGENVVQGTVNPDEYTIFKPLLDEEKFAPIIDKQLGTKEKKMVYSRGGSATTKNVDTPKKERRAFVLEDAEALQLAKWAVVIERHYERPMDIEWAKDGETGDLFIVQARPETVQSQKEASSLRTFRLKEKGKRLASGVSIGQAVAAGSSQVIESPDELDRFEEGSVLVTEMTNPDWVPIMKKAASIVTEQGGRTSHAAIVSRELGIPAVVGAADAMEKIEDGQEVTVSCVEGDEGHVYEGRLEFEEEEVDLGSIPETNTKVMLILASPGSAFRWWRLPADGIGLARMEFIINNIIKIHPMALVRYPDIEDKEAKRQIRELTKGYDDPTEYFVDHLAHGIARIAASQHPGQVIVRMSDFKTNEYADLIGGAEFEPEEENPMLGFRGASRYYSDDYREGFALECRAIRRVREEIGLKNVVVMIPFCRTPEEGEKVLDVLAKNGLKRGEDGLEVYVMAEIPSNITLAEQFAEHFDGFSIGTNDLTQLVLGVDRDSSKLSYLYDDQHEAIRRSISELMKAAHKSKRKVGICGQAPSDHPDFARFLTAAGIDSISVNPDSVLEVVKSIAKQE